jgi:hypothetical protein
MKRLEVLDAEENLIQFLPTTIGFVAFPVLSDVQWTAPVSLVSFVFNIQEGYSD